LALIIATQTVSVFLLLFFVLQAAQTLVFPQETNHLMAIISQLLCLTQLFRFYIMPPLLCLTQ